MKNVPSVNTKNIIRCASGLCPTYCLGYFSRKAYQRISCTRPSRNRRARTGCRRSGSHACCRRRPSRCAAGTSPPWSARRRNGRSGYSPSGNARWPRPSRVRRRADQIAGDEQDHHGQRVDPVPDPHRRLIDIDRAARDRLLAMQFANIATCVMTFITASQRNIFCRLPSPLAGEVARSAG